MLFDILLVVFAIYIMIMPFGVLKFVKFGIKAAEKPTAAADKPIFDIKLPKIHNDEPQLTEKQIRDLMILANVDRFDGTDAGQREIE